MNPSLQMRALSLRSCGRLEQVELPVPQPKPGEVLVHTRASTICTSDIHDIQSNPFKIALPRVLGHEGSGVIAHTGEGVADFKTGDAVAVHPVIPCGGCLNCARNLGHLCERMGHLGYDRNGTHAEYFCVPADRVRKIPAGVDFTVATLLEPVSVCLEAVKRVRLAEHETLLVVGDGPFGILIARLALRCRPARIILAGREEFRLRQVPSALPINTRTTPDVPEAIARATDGAGVDAAILAVSDGAALDLCVQALRARGRLGVFATIAQRTPVDIMRIHLKELELLGVCNDENLLDEALACLADEDLALASLITHRVPFAEWERAFDLAANHKDQALKVSMVFDKTA